MEIQVFSAVVSAFLVVIALAALVIHSVQQIRLAYRRRQERRYAQPGFPVLPPKGERQIESQPRL